MLSQVATELMRHDWDGILDVTPEFVVYAADYELCEVAESLAASVPESRLAQLRARGWL